MQIKGEKRVYFMKVTRLVLKNFRNYPVLDLAVSGEMVILTGPNSVGKTNLIEAVYFASLFKSFREDAEYVFLRGSNSASVSLAVEKMGNFHTLEIFLEQRERIYANFKVDGVKKSRKDAQGFIKVVVFEPRDVDMFGKSPETRRKYFNMVLSQESSEYLDALDNYKKVLANKQKILQDAKAGRGTTEDLASWNDRLAEFGTQIIQERRRFVEFLNNRLAEVYSGITGFHRPVEVTYETLPGNTAEETLVAFKEKLTSLQARELASGQSLVGPHRDDFRLHSEGVYLAPFSSRGELRSQVLALKILELEFLSKGGDKPVLLLDDVMSELDENRRTYLLKYLQGRFQTFITTTHPLELAAQHVTLSPSQEDTYGG